MMLFGHEPKELMKAFAVYGAAAPAGGTAGVFLGGVITEWISWPWVFWINIPLALVVLAVTPGLMPDAAARRGSVDLAGAVLASAGLAVTGLRDRARPGAGLGVLVHGPHGRGRRRPARPVPGGAGRSP
jgi:MFS family permease